VPVILFFSNDGLVSFAAVCACFSVAVAGGATAHLSVGVVVRGVAAREALYHPEARGFSFTDARVLTEKAGTVVRSSYSEFGGANAGSTWWHTTVAPVVDADWTPAQPVVVWVSACTEDKPPLLAQGCVGG
jgi:hypothetical protein